MKKSIILAMVAVFSLVACDEEQQKKAEAVAQAAASAAVTSAATEVNKALIQEVGGATVAPASVTANAE